MQPPEPDPRHPDPRRGGPNDDWPPLDIEIPDDLSELALEVQALRREQRAARRRAWLDRLLPTGHHSRYGLSGVIVGAGFMVGLLGTLFALLGPGHSGRSYSEPLNPTPAAAPGQVGGLLPELSLRLDRQPYAARDMRPGVVVLLPRRCDCASLVRALVDQTATGPLEVWLVAAGTANNQLAALTEDADAGHGRPIPLLDRDGVLAATYVVSPQQPTLLFVRADGVLDQPPLLFSDASQLSAPTRRLTDTTVGAGPGG